MKQTFLISLLLCVSGSLFAQNFVQVQDSTLQYLQAEDMRPNEKQGAYYNEHWSYHVMLDNDSELFLTYSISHFSGFRGSVTGARLSLLNWEGKDYHMAREYDHDDMVYDPNTFKFALHPNRSIWFEGDPQKDHRFFLRTEKDGVDYDMSVNFNNAYKGFTMGDGVFQLGNDDKVGIYSHIPFSNVSGFIALNEDTVNISGIGFMDQNFQTNVATRLFKTSYKYYGKDENGFSGGIFMVPKDHRNEVAGYAYSYDGESLTLKHPKTINVLKMETIMGKMIPTSIEVKYMDGTSETLFFNNVLEKISMLNELGGFKKMIAKKFLGGEILFYLGTAQKENKDNDYSFSISLVD